MSANRVEGRRLRAPIPFAYALAQGAPADGRCRGAGAMHAVPAWLLINRALARVSDMLSDSRELRGLVNGCMGNLSTVRLTQALFSLPMQPDSRK